MKSVLDVCCGSKMFYFDKNDPRVLFGDIRRERHTLCDNRELIIDPEVLLDFRALTFKDESFRLVVFDPPHLKNAGKNGWTFKKYGRLNNWQEDLKKGFEECFRVLEPKGVLIFKWNETQIKLNSILALTPHKPLFGHKTGKQAKTHWVCFIK